MKLPSTHLPLKFGRFDHFPEELVRREKYAIIKKDIVNTHHAFLAQDDVVDLRIAAMQTETDTKMSIVVQVGPGSDHPIDKPSFYERDKGRDTHASGD